MGALTSAPVLKRKLGFEQELEVDKKGAREELAQRLGGSGSKRLRGFWELQR